MTATIQKWGNSLGVRIPQKIEKQYGVENGAKLEIIATEQGIILKPMDRSPTLEELLTNYKPENRYEEIDFGELAGRELF